MAKRFVVAGLLVFAASAAAAAWFWFPWALSPGYTIRITTGPIGSDGQVFIAAFKRELTEEHPRARLVWEEVASLEESALALQGGKFDLAAARSDHPAVANGGTIVVLRRMPIVIMAPAKSSVASMKNLVGKKIAVLEGTAEDDPLLRTVMEFYGLEPGNIVKTSPAEIGAALHDKRVFAALAISPVGPGPVAEAVKSIVKATKKPPKFIDLEAKAIADQYPVYEAMEIPRGAFVAAPAIPGEEVTTVAVTVRLVAKKSMFKDVAGEMTRLLMMTRAKLAATMPLVGQIEAPDTDKKGVLPVHPGAAAYFDGSQVSFFEQAMDMLFNISIIGGLFGSVAYWIRSNWRRHRPNETRQHLARLSAILHEVRTAAPDQLDSIEEELDTLAEWMLDRFAQEQITAERVNAISAMLSQIRLLIERRRKA